MKLHLIKFRNACNAIVVLIFIGLIALSWLDFKKEPEPFGVWYAKLLKEQASRQPISIKEPQPEKVRPQSVLSKHEEFTEQENEIYWAQLEKTKTHADRTIKIHNSLPDLHFSIFGEYTDYFVPSHFEYRFGHSRQLKRMNLKNKMFAGSISRGRPIIEFVDINFDGYLDLRIFDNAGNVMWWYQTFLFDPGQKKFVYNLQLSTMSMLTVDSKNKRLYARGWDGIAYQGAARYIIKRNVLYLERVAVTQQGFLLENGHLVTSGKEYKRLLKSSASGPAHFTVLYAPCTQSGLLPQYKNFELPYYKASSTCKIISTEGDDVGEMVMRGMPNDDIKKSLWVDGLKKQEL